MKIGMDDGFKDRVDKVFGSISSSSSASWSVTDAQVERREWKRERDDDRIPVFSSFQDDNWDIRSSIGLDSTLDNEDEEDAYDKMAQGRENGGDRLYMKDVTDHGLYLNAHNVLPTSIHDVKKDPRANHDAAKTRLKEDALQGPSTSDHPMFNASQVRIKSILKRRKTYDDEEEETAPPNPAKRVSFDSTCKNADATRPQGFGPTQASSVPDYILNPSNYTRYTFDDFSPDGSNNNSSKHEEKSCPKSVIFIPRKKRGDAGCNSEEQAKQSSTQACSVSIAALEGEISEMQDDDDVCTKARSQKPVRQYRSKMGDNDDVS